MRIVVLCALLAFSPLAAALPPYYQSVREIEAILSDARLHERLGSGEVILQIMKTEGGYFVITQKSLLRVDVRYLPSKLMGPAQFELEINEPVSLTEK